MIEFETATYTTVKTDGRSLLRHPGDQIMNEEVVK